MNEKDDLLHSEEMRLVNEARDREPYRGFIANLFLGAIRTDLIDPFPEQDPADKKRGDAILREVKEFLLECVDPNDVDRAGEIPDDVIQKSKERGYFGWKIPRQYGGRGISQSNYRRVFQLIGSWCANMIAFLAPPNSIGAFIPIYLFGTEEQKRRYLPQLAQGKISAFALTEKDAGSDPSRIKTTARKEYKNGEHIGYTLRGEKIYTTGAVKADGVPLADYVVVVARIKDDPKNGRSKHKGFGLFLVDASSPGYSTPLRCEFMGLRTLYNGVVRLEDVFVPKENLIGAEGDGFKIAVRSLSVGRLTIAASCVGGLKQRLQEARWWCKERVQWRKPIGEHEFPAARLVRMACVTMVTDALVQYCSTLVDQKKDVRLESIFTKVVATEHLYESIGHLGRIRGGLSFETYRSQKRRGVTPIPVERAMRDAWINLIFEGENIVTTLFGLMEGVLEYLSHQLIRKNAQAKRRQKLEADLWFLKQGSRAVHFYQGKSHRQFIKYQTHTLVYHLLRGGLAYDMGLQRKQLIILQEGKRALNIFLMALMLSYAKTCSDKPLSKELADYFCQTIREEMTGAQWRTEWLLSGSHKNVAQLAKRIMAGEAAWLEEGIISELEHEGARITGWPFAESAVS